MIELKPQDLHVSLYNTGRKGSWDTSHYERGVTVIHFPTGTTVSVERHKSQHKNKNEVMIILKDLLTPFEVGSVVWTGYEYSLLVSMKKDFNTCTVESENGEELHLGLSKISHTKEGYRYKMVQCLKESLSSLEDRFYDEKSVIISKLKLLEEV